MACSRDDSVPAELWRMSVFGCSNTQLINKNDTLNVQVAL